MSDALFGVLFCALVFPPLLTGHALMAWQGDEFWNIFVPRKNYDQNVVWHWWTFPSIRKIPKALTSPSISSITNATDLPRGDCVVPPDPRARSLANCLAKDREYGQICKASEDGCCWWCTLQKFAIWNSEFIRCCLRRRSAFNPRPRVRFCHAPRTSEFICSFYTIWTLLPSK